MKKILDTIVLPAAVSDFELRYLERVNRVGLYFFALHLPAFMLVAYFNETGVLAALGLTLAVLGCPVLANYVLRNPRAVSVSYGFTAMLMGGLLVHFGQGPVQIEMHFYFFALLAMLALYGNPMVIVVAAGTVAVHHLLLWIYLPSSVFNYDAPIWVVAVHAAFVVLESIGTIYIARSFFENVIGLEKVVQKRTAELDLRNRDMRLVLDNVQQGFLTIDLDGVMSPERSAVIATWLGTADPGTTFADYLGRHAPHTADMFRGAWDQVVGGVLPPDVSLDQMPKKASVGERHLELEYIPICEGDELKKTLVVLSDVTVEVQRERLEAEQREVLHMFERALNDKSGFLEFFEESALQVNAIVSGEVEDTVVLKRIIHTLKGNSSIFGVTTVANLCHRMEAELAEEGQPPTAAQRNELSERWKALRVKVDTLLGENARRKIEVDDAECEQILDAISSGSPRPVIAKLISDWRLEPTSRRLRRIAEQARGIASRLEKGPIAVDFDAGDLRLDPELWTPFWSAFVHVVRNAIDHGIETADERRAADKPPEGVLGLTTRMESGQFVIEIRDDGRGVDWQAIKERAEERGLRAETEADLVEALFSDGISTRKIMSEYSGRGIGMGAVRAACAELGGAVSIHSTAGAGTRVEFTFPRTAMSAARRAQLVA